MLRSNHECSFMFCRTYNSLTVNANCSLMLNMVKCLEFECFMATIHSEVLADKCQCEYTANGQTLQ